MSNNLLNLFDSGDIEGITALIDKLEKSSFDYLKLEGGGMSVVIGKHGAGESAGGVAASFAAAAPEAAAVPSEALQTAPPEPQQKTYVPEQPGIFIIKSPSYGLYYSQPEPGLPPYVTEGAYIHKDDTVGLMEIMKTFSAITSPVDGEVAAIYVKNEETLEPGQPLISIKLKD